MPKSFLCSCGNVIDERSRPVPDIGDAQQTGHLSEQSSCPLCGAERQLFKPCICAPQPSISHKTDTREPALLAKLADYEAHLCESNRFSKIPLTKDAHPFTRLLRRVGYLSLTPNTSEIIDDAAYDYLLDHSANYYWFCRILASAATKGDKLPLGRKEIERGIDEVIGQLGSEFIDSRPIRDFAHWETANGVVRGSLLLEKLTDGTCRLVLNSVYGNVPRPISAGQKGKR